MKTPVVVCLGGFLLFFNQLRNCLARLGSLFYPGSNAFAIHAQSAACRSWIVDAQLFNISAVTWKAPIAYHNPIKRLFLCSMSAQSNGNTHKILSPH